MYGGLLAVAGIGASQAKVDYSAEQFFAFEGDDRATYDAYKEHFPREDLQVSVFLEVDGPLDVVDYRVLQRVVDSFRDAGLESIRWVGVAEFAEEVQLDGEPAVNVFRLEDDAALTAERLQEVVGPRRDHPLFAGTLWNRDLTVFAVHGFLDPDDNTDARRREITSQLESDVAGIAADGTALVLNGLPILRVTVPLALEADMSRLLGIGIVISFLVLWIYLSRFTLAALCFAGVLPAILISLGLMGYLGQPVSVMTSAVPIVILVVALSDATHLVVGTRRFRQGGLGLVDAVVATFSSLSRSCFFTSLTTALGFAGLVGTRNPLVGEFGVVTALSVMIAYVVTMTLLPALLAYARALEVGTTFPERSGLRGLRWVASRVEHRAVTVTTVFAAFLVGGVWLASGLSVEAKLIDDLKEGDPILEELRWMERSGFGVFQVNIYLDGEGSSVASAEMVEWMQTLQSDVARDPVVIGSIGLPDVVDELATVYGAPEPASGPTSSPDRRSTNEIAELLFLAELQDDVVLGDLYQREDGVAQLVLFVRDAGSSVLIPFVQSLEERLRSEPPPVGVASVTGTVKLTQVLWNQLVSRFLPGVFLSLVLVWLALSWMFRSVRLGLLAVVPNLFPLVMLLGVMALGGFDLKPTTIIVFSIAFGIVADDTIHFLGALAERMRDREWDDTILSETLLDVGPALVLVTIVVLTGFGVLMLGRFQVLFLIGLLTSMAAVLALITDLLGFPALLRILARRPSLQSLLSRSLS